MPSWVADKYSSKCVMTRFALIAFLFPSSISWLILVARTLTIANSEATKNMVLASRMNNAIKLAVYIYPLQLQFREEDSPPF